MSLHGVHTCARLFNESFSNAANTQFACSPLIRFTPYGTIWFVFSTENMSRKHMGWTPDCVSEISPLAGIAKVMETRISDSDFSVFPLSKPTADQR